MLSFFGGMKWGYVTAPDKADDTLLCVASMDDLFAHRLKVIHDRANGKDYQDIAVMLAGGQSLARGLAAFTTLFGTAIPPMIRLKSLTYFDDLNEPWRLNDDMKSPITGSRDRSRQISGGNCSAFPPAFRPMIQSQCRRLQGAGRATIHPPIE
ncbi:MAG: hypothetical protein FWD68_02790 [Alphaproteobacteria bacterium]|nr:hypothetical protein [Alphaproteobacteria bacterium]